MIDIAPLTTAVLFGGARLYAFGFAAFVFRALPVKTASKLLRLAFPHSYLFILATSTLAAGLVLSADPVSGVIFATIAVTTLFARQILMPAINAATDQGAKTRFKILHTLSVIVTLAHILGAGLVLLRLANG